MYRGVTPTITFELQDETVDLTEAHNVYVTFAGLNNRTVLNKTGNDLTIEPQSVALFLTQEETLALPTIVTAQVNWTYVEGTVTKRAATEKVTINTKENLLNEVIE